MDWKDLAGFAAPMIARNLPGIGSMLGSLVPMPGGAMMGEWIGKKIAGAMGVEPTPDAVHDVLTSKPADEVAVALAPVETEAQTALEELKARLADVQDARATGLEYVKAGSPMMHAPVVLSALVVLANVIISFLAMKPGAAGIDQSVTLYLLGAWNGYMSAVITYWLGSSNSSSVKTDQLAAIAAKATGTNVVPIKRKAA